MQRAHPVWARLYRRYALTHCYSHTGYARALMERWAKIHLRGKLVYNGGRGWWGGIDQHAVIIGEALGLESVRLEETKLLKVRQYIHAMTDAYSGGWFIRSNLFDDLRRGRDDAILIDGKVSFTLRDLRKIAAEIERIEEAEGDADEVFHDADDCVIHSTE